jgi:TRAP-type C4-dicarboxylate transport system substrate-binding protein
MVCLPRPGGILVETAREAGRYERQLIAESEEAYLETMRQAGVQITTLAAEQRGRFAKAAKPVHEWYARKYGGEILDAIRREIERITGGKK